MAQSRRVYKPDCKVSIVFVPEGEGVEEAIRLSDIRPISAKAESAPSSEAGKFSVELAADLFPADPRSIRTGAVHIAMGDISRSRFDVDEGIDPETNQIFLGTVDEIQENLKTEGTSRVQFKGRDYTGLLIDVPWSGRTVKLGPTLTATIERMQQRIDLPQSLKVRNLGETITIEQNVLKIDTGKQTRVEERRPAWTPDASMNAFEAMQKTARRFGMLVQVQQDELRIRPPRSPDLSQSAPLFVPGKNLRDLTVTRQFGARDIPNVRVKSHNPRTRQLVIGEWPQPFRTSDQLVRTGQRVKKGQSKQVREFIVSHPNPTEPILSKIAKRVHERFRQQQLKVRGETVEMATWFTGGSGRNLRELDQRELSFDLPTLKNGNTLRIWIHPKVRKQLRRATTEAGQQRVLKKRGFRQQVASELASSEVELDSIFFVSKAEHDFSDGGYSLSFEAKNAIEAGAV